MSDQVEEVKSKVDIVSIIGEHLELKKAGRNYKANCPFHGEKTPSFMVSPELQMYKCFGCSESGDVITFLEKYEGMEFREALQYLAERVGVTLTSFVSDEESEKQKIVKVNSMASSFYNWVLLNHPLGKKAYHYLTQDRGIKEETIKYFKIGFSPDAEGLLKKFLVDKKKYPLKDLEKAGLVFASGSRVVDKFRGRVVFPLFDHRGNVVGFSGRILPGERQDLAKYINSPETAAYHKSRMLFGLNFNKESIKKEQEAIVVEGELDMISPWQAGFDNIVAIKGSALTEDQVRLLSRFTKKIVLALDSDFAGDMAARRGIIVAQQVGLEIKVARFEKYKDPDEAVRADPKVFKDSVNSAEGVWDFIFDSIFSRYSVESGNDKAKVSREVIPVLASIPDKIVQSHYCNLVAKRLGVSLDAVVEQLSYHSPESSVKSTLSGIDQTQPEEVVKNRRQMLEERMISLALQTDPKLIDEGGLGSLITTPLARRLFLALQKYGETKKRFKYGEFIKVLPEELKEGFANLALINEETSSDDPEVIRKELENVIHHLKVTDIRHRLEVLSAKMRKFEEEQEGDKVEKSQQEFTQLTRELAILEQFDNKGIMQKDP